MICIYQNSIKIKLKCLPVADERCVHSRELFLATIPPQEVCDSYEKLLDPQGLIRSADLKKRSNERVIGNLKTDSLKSSTLNWYYSKGSGNGRKQIIFLKLVHPMEYSHPFIFSMVVYWFNSNRESKTVRLH